MDKFCYKFKENFFGVLSFLCQVIAQIKKHCKLVNWQRMADFGEIFGKFLQNLLENLPS